MNKYLRRLLSGLMLICMLLSLFPSVYASPSATKIVTEPSGYTSASDVVYTTVDGYIPNWGARGEDCTFLSTYAQSFYSGVYRFDTLSKLSGGTSTTAPDSVLYASLNTLMTEHHTYFTKYGSTSSNDCKNLYQYTDCMLGDPSYVSTLYRGDYVAGEWNAGTSYNQEHVWPKSKSTGTTSTDIGDIMQLRAANPNENSSRNNTAYGESSGYYDPGISVRGDCARTILYMYVRWGNTEYMWGTDGVMESLDVLLRWVLEDPVDTWEMGHNDAVQSITGTRNVFVDYPEFAWLLFGQSVPANLQTPSNGAGSGDAPSTENLGTATLITDPSSLKAGDQIIIAALDYNYAISTTQNTGNRGQAAISKYGSFLYYSDDVQIITLNNGSIDGTFAMSVGDGQYLYAASSSSNYLKTTNAISGNASWDISIDAATGAATLTACGSYTRNVLRYNASYEIFSCYSANNSQKDIAIYRIEPDDDTAGDTPEDIGESVALVTDISSLKVGDQIIIAARDYDFALGTTQNTNNRSRAVVTKSGAQLQFDEGTQIITLAAGNMDGAFALQVGNGKYLCAASSSGNYLRTASTVSDHASWTISIDPATGAATLTANGSYSRNVLRYNHASGLFSCYAVNNSQKDLSIYKITANSVPVQPDYYLFGYINGANYACEGDAGNLGSYKFVDGKLKATFNCDSYVGVKTSDNAHWYMTDGWQGTDKTSVTLYDTTKLSNVDKFFVPGNVELTFTLTENADGSLTLSYSTNVCEHHYVGGFCTLCGAANPNGAGTTKDYYLFGYINGADYGTDGGNPGQYQFVNGKLKATFTCDSYVGVRTSDNASWYMTDGWQGNDKTSITLYDTTTLSAPDKFFVPGNVELTFVLTENSDGSINLRYTVNNSSSGDASVVPTLTAKYPTVSFEDVIILNIYFDAQNIDDVVEMGMLTFPEKYDTAAIALAEEVIPGYIWNDGAKLYTTSTNGIPAKELGKTIYFAVYAKLTDGTYAYSKISGYSVEKYAKTQLEKGSDEMKALMVATLNYAAAAQVRFDYNADALVNASLTEAQQALNIAYSEDMITAAEKPEGEKLGEMVNNGGYTRRYPTVSFEGAFSINFYFAPSAVPVGDITMYVWNQADYNAAASLSKENASYAITMEKLDSGEYLGIIENIAAKQLNDAVYVSFCYSDGTTDYCAGVIGYSIGLYCKSQAAKTGAMADLAKATAVYGYYAKQRFG